MKFNDLMIDWNWIDELCEILLHFLGRVANQFRSESLNDQWLSYIDITSINSINELNEI